MRTDGAIVQREQLDSLSRKCSELDRRLNVLEGKNEAVFRESLKEALLALGREHLQKHGSLEGFDPGTSIDNSKKQPGE